MGRWKVLCTVILTVAVLGPVTHATTIAGRVTGPGGAGVKDAVVFLAGPKGGAPLKKHPVLDQRNQSFAPHVMAVLVGTTVQFPNHDTVFHNVFSFREGKKFDLGMYPVGARKSVVFDRPGLVRIFCNIHSNMSAFIFVSDNPYFDVSGKDGSFTIKDAPEGDFTLQVWHENYRNKSEHVSVRGGQKSLDFQLSK
ncbi:MAG: methylamine utilization protein [Armatimonadetes bacterium]|nr:methylamine utilization protein [Armatimonadota bacterium]